MIKRITISLIFLFFVGPAWSSTYYVKDDGNDSLDGLTDATAWRTLTKVNNTTFAAGDDVYFKCDDTWAEQQLVINWSGTSENYVTIGAYYGSGTIGVSGDKPIIDGENLAPDTPDGVFPSGGLIQVNDSDYILIENLHITRSYGHAIRFFGSASDTHSTYCYAKNIETSYIYSAGIQYYRADHGEVDSCNVHHTSLRYYYTSISGLRENSTYYASGSWINASVSGAYYIYICTTSGTTASSQPSLTRTAGNSSKDGSAVWLCHGPASPTGGWPGVVSANQDSSYVTVKNCKIYNNHGEGIGFYKASDYCVAEYNLLYNNFAVGIYIDGSKDCVVRYNMIYGTTDSTYWRWIEGGTSSVGMGIALADEGHVTERCENIDVYGNFVAFTGSGLEFGAPGEGSFSDIHIYNNTFIENKRGIKINAVDSALADSYIINNIIWNSPTWPVYNTTHDFPLLSWDYNLWSSSPPAGWSGSHDVIGNPLLSKTTGWRSLTAGSLDEDDFAIQAGSPAIDAGSDLGDSYDDGLDVLLTGLPDTVTLLDRDNFGAGWDIGAAEYKGSAVIADPTGLIQVGYSTEEDVRSTGGSLVITLSDAVWEATVGDDNALTTALIAGIDGNLNDSTAWDAIVKAGLDHTNVVRTSDSIVTITVPAFSSYDIDTTETISTTIPASCTNAVDDIICKYNGQDYFYISAIITASVASGVGYSVTGKQVLRSDTGSEWRYLGE